MSHVLEKTVVLSDLHANGRALRAAIARADELGFDRIVVLGDLLTYGIDQNEVLDLVFDLQDRRGATVLIGNHDKLYLDLAEGDRTYYRTLPAWLRESVDLTLTTLDTASFRSRFRWSEATVEGPWLLAHANPWPIPDWRYIRSEDDARAAAARLRERAFIGGIFGHTHRRHATSFNHDGGPARVHQDSWAIDETEPMTTVVNPGSIGQPRHTDACSTFLHLERGEGTTRGTFVPVLYDVQAHVDALRRAPLSEPTRETLCRFFNSSAAG